MAYYLQMDGVDDYIKCPPITMTHFEISMNYQSKGTTEYIFDGRTGLNDTIIYNGTYKSGLGLFTGTTGTTYVDGVAITNSTNIPRDTTILLKAVSNVAFTDDVNFFSRNDNTSFGKGNIYDIKIYNGATLVAHYDMSTGTVQDQSGNGNHTTLVGGTWVDDGSGGGDPEPTPTTYEGTAVLTGSGSLISEGTSLTPTTVYEGVTILSGSSSFVGTGNQVVVNSITFSGLGSVVGVGSSEVVPKVYEGMTNLIGSASLVGRTISIFQGTTQLSGRGSLVGLMVIPKIIAEVIRLSAKVDRNVYLHAERKTIVRLKGGIPMETGQNFSMVAGDYKRLEIGVKDVNRENLNGLTFKWMVHHKGSQQLLKTGIVENDQVVIDLSSSDTSTLIGDYEHVLQIIDLDFRPTTSMIGRLNITKKRF